ncbi:3-oxoadipate enol-lactonase [Sesbania bispinosa]|nr:3-oxoadipate enol-lactonase [Sesbania bispinosa]
MEGKKKPKFWLNRNGIIQTERTGSTVWIEPRRWSSEPGCDQAGTDLRCGGVWSGTCKRVSNAQVNISFERE